MKFIPETSKELRLISKNLTFVIEGASFSQKYQDGKWDGKKYFFKNKNEIAFGLSKYVCEICEENGIEFKLTDFDKFNPELDISKIALSEGLREHQVEAVETFFDNPFGPHGIAMVPTRGGKTFTATECIRITRLLGYKKSIFIVDGTDLFTQTIAEFAKFFNIAEDEIGQLQGAGVWDFKEINVAMIQSISRIFFPSKEVSKTVIVNGEKVKRVRKKNESEIASDKSKKYKLEKLIRDTDFVIIDEVQEYTSSSRLGTIKKFKSLSFLLSLSATPFKSEGEIGNLLLREVLGDVIYEVKEDPLIESGSLVKNKVIIISFEDEIILGDTYLDYYNKNIIHNENRNKIILNLVVILERLKLKSLFMIARKEHGHKLAKESGVTYVSGDDASDVREKEKTEFLEKEAGTLFASDIYKKGVSLNSCEVLVSVSGGKEKSAIIQKRGRILAAVDGKLYALMIDIFDSLPYFSEHSLNRLEAYVEKVGEENVIVIDANNEDFYEDLESTIKEFFNGA